MRCVLPCVDEWDLVATLVMYVINYHPRQVLGGRSAIEVVTGRAPDSTVKETTWSGVDMKSAVTCVVETAKIDNYCEQLALSLDELHTKARDVVTVEKRRKTLCQANHGTGLRFNVGDLVMIPSFGNGVNKTTFRPFKPMVGWQGPYLVTRIINGSPFEFMVRLLDEAKEHPILEENATYCRGRPTFDKGRGV